MRAMDLPSRRRGAVRIVRARRKRGRPLRFDGSRTRFSGSSALHELDEIQVHARRDERELDVDLAVQGYARKQLHSDVLSVRARDRQRLRRATDGEPQPTQTGRPLYRSQSSFGTASKKRFSIKSQNIWLMVAVSDQSTAAALPVILA
jgi:hypothetical protein